MVLLLSMFSSCVSDPAADPSILPYSPNPFLRAAGPSAIGSSADTAQVEACFALERSKTYVISSGNVINEHNDALMRAAFNDGTNYTQVKSATINNYPLAWYYNNDPRTVFDPKNGSYGAEDLTGISSPSKGRFLFSGFQQQSFDDSVEVSSPFELDSIRPFDTVNLSKGLRLRYRGFSPGDTIYIRIRPDVGTNLALIGPSAIDTVFVPGQYLYTSSIDSGVVRLTANDFRFYIPGRYIQVQLIHWKYQTRLLPDNKRVGFYSDYTLTFPLFISAE